jgi:pimeloyl-ACP methyl ester carboxylesterase
MPACLTWDTPRPARRTAPAAILPHGSRYDIHSFVDVAPLLASAGYRAIVPYLRGYGMTRFPAETIAALLQFKLRHSPNEARVDARRPRGSRLNVA